MRKKRVRRLRAGTNEHGGKFVEYVCGIGGGVAVRIADRYGGNYFLRTPVKGLTKGKNECEN